MAIECIRGALRRDSGTMRQDKSCSYVRLCKREDAKYFLVVDSARSERDWEDHDAWIFPSDMAGNNLSPKYPVATLKSVEWLGINWTAIEDAIEAITQQQIDEAIAQGDAPLPLNSMSPACPSPPAGRGTAASNRSRSARAGMREHLTPGLCVVDEHCPTPATLEVPRLIAGPPGRQ